MGWLSDWRVTNAGTVDFASHTAVAVVARLWFQIWQCLAVMFGCLWEGRPPWVTPLRSPSPPRWQILTLVTFPVSIQRQRVAACHHHISGQIIQQISLVSPGVSSLKGHHSSPLCCGYGSEKLVVMPCRRAQCAETVLEWVNTQGRPIGGQQNEKKKNEWEKCKCLQHNGTSLDVTISWLNALLTIGHCCLEMI